MDPFEVINPVLHELVLQHFTGSEVLKSLSLVSVEWSHLIGQSKKCMNKIRFAYQVWRHQFYSSTEVFRCIQDSLRHYQHVSFELGMTEDSRQFWNFIEMCCSSLVTLRVENIRKPLVTQGYAFEFPNLEVYIAYGLDDSAMTPVLNTTRKLKNIFISSSDPTMDPTLIESLVLCLQNNPNLQEVYLKNVNFVNIYDKPLEVNFQLKSLKLMNTSAENSISSMIEKNLLNFLNQQSPTLETFFFEFKSEDIVECIFNNLPMLTSTGLLNVDNVNLQANPRIKNLEIPYIEEISDIKKFVDAAPNLETLFVGTITKELVEYLAWNFMKLESLNFKFINLDAEEHYEKLKADHPEVNQNIEIWDYENVDWD